MCLIFPICCTYCYIVRKVSLLDMLQQSAKKKRNADKLEKMIRIPSLQSFVIFKWNRGFPDPRWKYSGLSLSRLLSISNFSLFRTKSSVPWTFVHSLSYFYLFISNFSISNFSLSRTKILIPCH